MLTELRLSALGVVDEAVIPLGPGLTVLTGETGAGKTMIVAGLGLLLGARADASMVRHGKPRAVVEGRWTGTRHLAALLDELGAEEDDGELLLSRHVTAQGRSRAIVGGVQAPIGTLASLTDELATIHGQSEQVRLAHPERQREILDSFASPALLPRYRADWAERRRLATELDQLVTQAQSRARELDMLRFGLAEINAVEPQEGEDEELAAEANRLMDAEDLMRLAAQSQAMLSGDEQDFDAPSAVAMLGQARKHLINLAERDTVAAPLAAKVHDVEALLGDLAADVAGYAADLVADPARLEAVGERRAALASLTRKYGPSLGDVLAWARDASCRVGDLEHSDERIEELRQRIRDLDERLAEAGRQITAERVQAAERIAQRVVGELQALALPHARLVFEVTPGELGPHGADAVELLFSANPGSTPGPLGRVASGGELSRVRLALEVVLASGAEGHTFVFDEVDAGVGGAVGLEIGRRLKRLAAASQVVVVTHLAQVAAFADHHFVISKSSDGQVTTSGVSPVSGKDREAELARMMGGQQDSQAGARHARELLALARD